MEDDSVDRKLVEALRLAGHDVFVPTESGRRTIKDQIHFTAAIRIVKILIARNYGDFEDLHDLIVSSGGSHPGLIVVRRDNDRRDMKPHENADAIDPLSESDVPIPGEMIVLKHYRRRQG